MLQLCSAHGKDTENNLRMNKNRRTIIFLEFPSIGAKISLDGDVLLTNAVRHCCVIEYFAQLRERKQ
jgi:hypothetical protein